MTYRPAPVPSGAAPVPAIEARLEPDANRNGHMIGYQWTVYRRRDGGGPDGIVATGMTDRPDKAKSLVEMIVGENGAAAWGSLLRVALGGGPSSWRADQAAGWPPAGEIQVCSSAGDGCLSWGPLYPRDRAGVWDADAAGVSAGVAATAGERR